MIIKEIQKNIPFWSYVPRSIPMQFLGFLIVHYQLESIIRKSTFKVNDLSPEIVKELEEIFLDFNFINYRCLDPILNEIPKADLMLIHYFQFEFPKPNFDEKRKINLLDKDLFNKFLDTFWEHPSFEIIKNNLDLVEDSLANYLPKIEKLIDNGKLDKTDLFHRILQSPPSAIDRRSFNLVFALICLKKSIFILNELLYWSILIDKIPCIDSSNIVTFPKVNENFIRKKLEITCQINKKNSNLAGPLLLFFYNSDPIKMPTKLYLCQEKQISMSQEFGDEIVIFADNIDNNLNPYANLLSIN